MMTDDPDADSEYSFPFLTDWVNIMHSDPVVLPAAMLNHTRLIFPSFGRIERLIVGYYLAKHRAFTVVIEKGGPL